MEDYGLVNFIPLSIESKEMMLNVKNNIDKANGYCFGAEERNIQSYMSSAYGVTDFEYSKTSEVREKFMEKELDKIDQDTKDTLAENPNVIIKDGSKGFQV